MKTMKTLARVLAVSGLLGVGAVSLMSQTPSSAFQTKSFRTTLTQPVHLRYLLFLPKEYGKDPARKWPLMLFLHGAGERGDDLWKVTVHGPPKLARNDRNFPFILVCPQCPTGDHWHADALAALLDRVIETHAVDTHRVYLTGLSMGGYGTWHLGLTHPDRFAAIVPICGGGNTEDVLLASPRHAEALRSLPVWAFHGAKDQVVNPEESKRMVKALKRFGCREVKLTIYPDANHNSWDATYNNPEVFRWMLDHSRP
jgi:predicted peptidase